jgi:hypothetical protein
MAGIKRIEFDPRAIMALLTHYTDGEVPLNGEVRAVVTNEYLSRYFALLVESDEWQEQTPLHIRYQGKRTLSWKKGQEHAPWKQKNETPKRQ